MSAPTSANEAFIYDVLRTPRGKGKPGGSLYEVKPVELVSGLLKEIAERNPSYDPGRVDDVVLGCVTPVGDQGADIAKISSMVAGLPESVAGVQLNRFCGSGLESVNQAAARIRSGMEDMIIAGGVESMSRVPMGTDGGAMAMDPQTALDTNFVPQGIGADLIATIDGVSREDVDRFAVRSQERAARAWDEGRFAKSIVPVKDRNGLMILDHDEYIRRGTTVESLSSLKPAFAMIGEHGGFDSVALEVYPNVDSIDHVHHAGNSSGIVDGAAVVLIGSEQVGKDMGLTPLARIVSMAVVGSEPTIMLTGPAPASRKALAKAGLTAEDMDIVEINEAFASVALRLQSELNIPDEKLNPNGGAIAMGHPLGATGAIILGTLVDELERTGGRYGLATLCIGGGMGIATIVERI
ncbi:MAG: acetyl-CoA C-acetyltransferase [Actinomycetia bacterium]|nr:acetyl-CoA C-acetyltransferase [Actinomycetes bacterium]